jgi:signal transduction histidine kinase/CheY-like chemotaxis protein/HPt (histidine-containing phosphotransfer) domain-containing protein
VTTRLLRHARGATPAITAIVLAMGILIAALMSGYHTRALEPRLRAEATAQAEILSRSQGGLIATAARASATAGSREPLERALEELLLLRDAGTGTPYFESITIELDSAVLGVSPGALDVRSGEATATAFVTDVPLLDPASSEVLGGARFAVSSRLFRELQARIASELRSVTLAVLALLALVWAILIFVFRNLEGQIEKRLRAERQLSQQEERYERLVDNLDRYFVYRKNANGIVETVSASVTRVLGLTPLQFSSLHAASLGATLSSGSSATPDADDRARSREVDLVDAHGAAHRIELSEVAVRDELGRITAIDGIARDATAERKFQDALRQAKDDAEAANRAKSQFLANMSHEIRTPLNAILGLTGLALRSARADRDRDLLEKIRASSRLLVEIIEDVLDLSRIEAGRLEVAREPFDLDVLLSELSDVISPRASARGIEVAFEVARDAPKGLVGDAVRLKQVLINLLNNAVKFTEAGGEVVARIEPVETRRDRAIVRFSVRDTGIGIPAAHVRRLFEPFTQVDPSSTRRYGGMGLGLAISKRLVRLMGGDIAVESEVSRGSVFTFTIEAGVVEGAENNERRLPQALSGLKALVVDDSTSARLALSSMLESFSCRVESASSAEDALRVYERSGRDPFRVALIDWKMPGMDGVAAARELRRRAQGRTGGVGRDLAIILVTAFDWDQAQASAEAGVGAVLRKPVSPSALHDAIVSALNPGERRPRRSSQETPRFAPGQSVLVVEDQEINREVARELLSLAGLAVTEATNGREAIETLRERKRSKTLPGAVLMDVQMPDMDGLQAVRTIRDELGLEALPVIAMTAHAMLGDRERFLAASMSDYVAKPIDEGALFAALGRFLRTEDAGPSVATRSERPEPRAAETEHPEPIVLDRVAGLRRVSGNEALYARLVTSFVNETENALGRLRRAKGAGDQEALRIELHTLKGNAATIGAEEAQAVLAEAERSLTFNGPHLERIESSLGRVAAFVRRESPSARPLPSAPVSASELDPSALQGVGALLDSLTGELARGSLDARQTLARVKAALRDHETTTAALIEIEHAIEAFDLGRAESLVRDLRERVRGAA